MKLRLVEYKAEAAKLDRLAREAKAVREQAELENQKAEDERLAELEANIAELENEASGKLRLGKLCNWFLTIKKKQMNEKKELSPKSYAEYVEATKLGPVEKVQFAG